MTLKTVFVVALGTLLVVAVVWALVHAGQAIVLTAISALLATTLDHLVKRAQKRMRRSLAIVAVVSASALLMAGVGLLVVPAAVTQGRELIKAGPQLMNGVRSSPLVQRLAPALHLEDQLANPGEKVGELVKARAAPLLALVGGALSLVSSFIVVCFLTIFMLVFGGELVERAVVEARAERVATYRDLVTKIHTALGGYVTGLAVICSINGTLGTIFLAINHTPFFIPLGLLSGCSSLIPYAGPLVAASLISLVAFATGGVSHGIAAVIYFAIYGLLEGNVLGPMVFKKTVRTNPLLVTLAILFFAEVGGIFGAVIAVPTVAVLQIVVVLLLEMRRAALEARRQVQA